MLPDKPLNVVWSCHERSSMNYCNEILETALSRLVGVYKWLENQLPVCHIIRKITDGCFPSWKDSRHRQAYL
jgi:hypothetical protein